MVVVRLVMQARILYLEALRLLVVLVVEVLTSTMRHQAALVLVAVEQVRQLMLAVKAHQVKVMRVVLTLLLFLTLLVVAVVRVLLV
jgi:hypothetical protein